MKNCDVHLYAEIEILKQALADKQNELLSMETTCLRETDRQAELEDSIIAWQDKYDRLYESHKRVQKVNQTLEDKLLKLVDRNSGERAQLTSDVATLSVRLAQANYNIATLQREIERYKTDMSLAIQLLQCKPDSFVSQKVSSLPLEIQSKVAQYMRLDSNSHSDSEGSTSGVGVATSGAYRVLPASDSPPPLCPFPPTAMVYSMRGIDEQTPNDSQMISPSVIAKYLEDELKSSEIKHCNTCSCTNRDLTVLADTALTYSIGTQTILQGDANNSLCLRCNSNLNSPSRTNSPYIIKLVKSSDSVISETKSSVSGSNDNDKLFTPVKKDELMVNPILGHHRLCDRTPKIIDTASKCVEMQLDSNDMHLKQQKSPIGAFRSPDNTIASSSNNSSNKKHDASHSSCKDSEQQVGKIESMQNTGSTNSLWSKTSSNTNNTDCAKIFENFNRNLIKTMKVDFPKAAGPRLCALRIQNGSSNILLDNIESELSPVIYTRRSRLLDEELDESKDIIASNGRSEPSNISMVMSGTSTDQMRSNYENFIENNTNSKMHTETMGTMDISNSSNSENVGTKQHQLCLDKLESETMSSKHANQSCTQSSSISSEMNIQESAMLRRQQLTRVAEWVQNNHLDQMEPLSSQSASSMDAVSIDSGYKTKVRTCANDLVVVVDNDHLHSNDRNDIIVANIKDSNRIIASTLNDEKSSTDRLLLDNSFAQTQNNNFLQTNNDHHQQHHHLHHQHLLLQHHHHHHQQQQHQQQQLRFVDDLQNGIDTTILTTNGNQNGNAQIDLAQMEYNVKQFLLKQNEWSIHNKNRFDGNLATTNATKNLHRTETNL